MIGTTLAHYQIVEKIGAGGMGDVYRARDTKLDRDVALKTLPSHLSSDRSRLRRFEREAKAIAALNHPHIVHVYSVDEAEGVSFLTMELVEGESLADLIPPDGLPISRVLEIGSALAGALASAHAKGIVHRDVKPTNAMITRDGRAKILDFGLAKHAPPGEATAETLEVSQPLTGEGAIVGTPPYMSPEQLRGEDVSPQTDIFSLGIVLYEATCGKRPFGGAAFTEVASKILVDEPAALTSVRADTPYDLDRIVARCLRKDPDRRFQTARDVRNELDDLVRLLGSNDSVPAVDLGAETQVVGKTYPLTANLVRELSHREPDMINDTLTYLDNSVQSDVLVILLHGLAHDQRQFTDTLRRLPVRAIAPTMYGWSLHSKKRHALSLDDHSKILRAFFGDCQKRLRPRRVVVGGFSSGADHVVRMVCSEEGAGIEVDGMVLWGCNIDISSCFYSRVCADLTTGDASQILAQLKQIAQASDTLSSWLTGQKYLVQCFNKFGVDVASLRQYGRDIVAPFEAENETQFVEWYRGVTSRVPVVRFVCSREDFAPLDRVLRQHLESNVLGDSYSEETIHREEIAHVELAQAECVVRHVLSTLSAVEAS